MSKPSKPASHRAAIVKNIKSLSHRHSLWGVWRDWLEISALALRNAVDRQGWDDREKRYLQVISKYDRDQVQLLVETLAELVSAMELETGDVLGSIYMELELGNKNTGQFFTPYDLSRMMAKMTLSDGQASGVIAEHGFVTVQEPACGGGAMIVAMAEELREAGFNPQKQMHVTAVDVDIKAVHMAYIQLSLLHIPAVILHGDALTVKVWDQWFTPAHIMGGWSAKLRARQSAKAKPQALEPVAEPVPLPAPPPLPDIPVGQNHSLF